MTWRELKQQLDQVPESELDKKVQGWGERTPLTGVQLQKCEDDMYFDSNWPDEPCAESCNYSKEDLESDDLELVAEKGMFYLQID